MSAALSRRHRGLSQAGGVPQTSWAKSALLAYLDHLKSWRAPLVGQAGEGLNLALKRSSAGGGGRRAVRLGEELKSRHGRRRETTSAPVSLETRLRVWNTGKQLAGAHLFPPPARPFVRWPASPSKFSDFGGRSASRLRWSLVVNPLWPSLNGKRARRMPISSRCRGGPATH